MNPIEEVELAQKAINEAGLTDSGYHYLLGALVAASPQAVHRTLEKMRRKEIESPDVDLGYFRKEGEGNE
jgi:hypothetical protein